MQTLQPRISARARDDAFHQLHQAAHAAGLEATATTDTTPMIVTDGVKTWYAGEGPCGFAWVRVRPATSSFARWAMKHELMRKSYTGGAMLWVHDFNQSLELKTAYAHAYAQTLRDAGIDAQAEFRMD